MKNIAVIGAGRAGLSVAKNLNESCDFRVTAVTDINEEFALRSRDFLGNIKYTGSDNVRATELADIIIISTPDDYIEATCNKLSEYEQIRGKYIFHLSGSRPSTILSAAKSKNCFIGSIHPLQSMPSPEEGYKNLKNAFFCIEGDSEAVEVAKKIVAVISGKYFTINTEMKSLYHAAAVFASNFINTTVFASFYILKDIGVPEDNILEIILPLIKGTVNNIEKLGVIQSLTGPVVRGDFKTIASHLQGLEKYNNDFLQLYLKLSETTVKLAKLNNNPPELSNIEELLHKYSNN